MSDLFFDTEEEPGAPPPEHIGEPEAPGFRRWVVVVAVVAVLALLALGVAGLWVQRRIDPPGPPGEEIALSIPRGATTAGVAELLEREGVIADAQIFRLYLRVKGGGPFQAGDYVLRRNSSIDEVVSVLEAGPAPPESQRLTVPEGLTIAEVAERVGSLEGLDAEQFAEAVASGVVRSRFQPADVSSLEGLLFPETYAVEDDDDEVEVLRRMVETFDAIAAELGYDDAPARVGLSPYETVIVASLVEAEAKDDADRAKISRVIHNRLEQGIPLGIDATFYFALGRRGGSLTRSDLAIDSPYNTRENAGLVPTPIAIPGRASLEAALNPEPGPWLYYVLKDQRTHAFSESYQEFLRNKREAQRKGLIP